MERIVLVDENDNVIGAKPRDERTTDDIARVAALWLTNTKGGILLAQRSFTKNRNPGVWTAAAAGTVVDGEDYETNMIREVKEELGLDLKVSDLVFGPKHRVKAGVSNHFLQYYLCTHDVNPEDLVLQREEIEQVAWFTPRQLKEEIQTHPENFSHSASQWGELLTTSK